MTKTQSDSLTSGLKADRVQYWFPVILAILTITTAIWSSSADNQKTKSLALENTGRIERHEERADKRLGRIETKVDILIGRK